MARGPRSAVATLRNLPVFRDRRVIRRCALLGSIPADSIAPGSVERECETCLQPVWYFAPQQPDERGEKLMCTGCVDIYLILRDIAGLPRPLQAVAAS